MPERPAVAPPSIVPPGAAVNQRVFVTGGSGFVGTAVLGELLARGRPVLVAVHRKNVPTAGVISVRDAGLRAADLVGCVAVVHLVGIIREMPGQTFRQAHVETTRRLVGLANAAGVRRFVYVSALGASHDSGSAYARTKAEAEDLVRASGMDWTVFRPSLVHGPDGAFVRQMTAWAKGAALPYAFMPYFGVGLVGHTARRVDPVDVRDVARAVADAVDRPDLVGQTVALVGGQPVTWPQMYQVVSETVTGRLKPAVGLPVWYGKLLATLVPNRWLPFDKGQVVLAGQDNVADADAAERQLGWRPRPFPAAFREYGGRLNDV